MNQRNEIILQALQSKVRERYAQDICLMLLYGSTTTGDEHPRSDLDLIFVPATERAAEVAACMIVEGVGYDFFGMSWERLERIARLEEGIVSILMHSQVVYSRSPEDLRRLEALRLQVETTTATPISADTLDKAKRIIDEAMLCYARLMLGGDLGECRENAAGVLYYLSEALCLMNNTYFRYGNKRRAEELAALPERPEGFDALYQGMLRAEGTAQIRQTACALLGAVRAQYRALEDRATIPQDPQKGLRYCYEELICNWYNKIMLACETGDYHGAYLAGLSCQNYLDTFARRCRLPRCDIMGKYNADDLTPFKAALEEAAQAYLAHYRRYGVPLYEYPSAQAFRDAYLSYDWQPHL